MDVTIIVTPVITLIPVVVITNIIVIMLSACLAPMIVGVDETGYSQGVTSFLGLIKM